MKAIHKENALFNCDTFPHQRSVWIDIIQAILDLRIKGINLFDSYKKLIGNGDNIRFWTDVCLREIPLKVCFPRLFLLETDKKVFVAFKCSIFFLGWILFVVLFLVEPRVSKLLCLLSFVI